MGLLTAGLGSALGLAGALLTSEKSRENRHLGFKCWLVNSPLLIISLACYGAWALIPLNACYLYTAWNGYRNTKEPVWVDWERTEWASPSSTPTLTKTLTSVYPEGNTQRNNWHPAIDCIPNESDCSYCPDIRNCVKREPLKKTPEDWGEWE